MARQKTRRDENFPVGSLLVPPNLRADVHAYYRFARTADDIADSPDIEAREKLTQLDAMERVLTSGDAPQGMDTIHQRVSIELKSRFESLGLAPNLGSDLLIAFRLDAENRTYRTWAELIDYCRFSACPVGRFLLALHGEKEGHQESDALCTALQLLNHIQDAKDDWTSLNRLYVPTDWMEAESETTDSLSAAKSSPALRRIITRMLENTEKVVHRASDLPRTLHHRSLAAEAKVCTTLAIKLCQRLQQQDPIAKKVKLSALDWLTAGTHGLLRVMRP